MKNKVLTGLLLVLIGGWGNLLAQNAGSNYARQVNTLIGTKGVGLTSGYLYPGATYPYGMVQFTPSYNHLILWSGADLSVRVTPGIIPGLYSMM
jgi:putative alpha-1,2-mannosidase